jgi:hypothetical protein
MGLRRVAEVGLLVRRQRTQRLVGIAVVRWRLMALLGSHD